MNTLWQDLRFGARMMIKAPGFTLIAVLSIALGIAVNSAVFTLVNGMLLKPMPVRQPDRLVALYTVEPNSIYPSQFSYPDYVDYRDHNQVFSDLFIHFTTQGLSLKGREGAAEMVCGEYEGSAGGRADGLYVDGHGADDGAGRAGVAGGLRERGEPIAGARDRAAKGDRRATGARREPPSPYPATVDGERNALDAGRRAWLDSGDLAQRPVQIRRPEG